MLARPSASRVKSAMDADAVTVADIEGGKRYEVTRGACRAKFDLYDEHVNWVSLTSPGKQGWARDAHKMARELFPQLGVKYLIASPAGPEAAALLKAHGDWRDTPQGLRWEL